MKKITPKTWSWRKFTLYFGLEMAAIFLVSIGIIWALGGFKSSDCNQIVPGSIVVGFKVSVNAQQAKVVLEQYGVKPTLEKESDFDIFHYLTVEVPSGKEEYYSGLIRSNPLVEHADPDRYGCLD